MIFHMVFYILTISIIHIDFFESSEAEIVGMGFSESNNILRLFMGLPKTFTTDESVSPLFLLEVVIKIIIAVVLIIYLRKNNEEKIK